MPTVYIICNNDGIHHAVIGTGNPESDKKYAKTVMERFKSEYEKRVKKQFGPSSKDAEYQIAASYWHIHNVSAEEAV